eukprot:gnl/TRDRNA2_/TRDRNA2_212976_c0_seq1.p1 gnl/TRDRNA2_/TRDRNA2_212976_c0~~gnl/TRDRNA2_/TRDRNA2_212976_c0_seq1.p1  ORF type:complete len:105 (+),score=16.88 gnl/TRDRNA2_/TRDRNA2_212976_c0_seq1:15-329(+)
MSDNPLERATQLGQKLFEIQTSSMTELARMQQENVQKYMEMSQDFASKLSEVKDPQTLMELQRQMGESMWQNIQSSNENSGQLVREAWEQVGEAYKDAFTPDSE